MYPYDIQIFNVTL